MTIAIDKFDLYEQQSDGDSYYVAEVYYSYGDKKKLILQADSDIDKALERLGNNITELLCDETYADRLNLNYREYKAKKEGK